jgi:hypothetical protein
MSGVQNIFVAKPAGATATSGKQMCPYGREVFEGPERKDKAGNVLPRATYFYNDKGTKNYCQPRPGQQVKPDPNVAAATPSGGDLGTVAVFVGRVKGQGGNLRDIIVAGPTAGGAFYEVVRNASGGLEKKSKQSLPKDKVKEAALSIGYNIPGVTDVTWEVKAKRKAGELLGCPEGTTMFPVQGVEHLGVYFSSKGNPKFCDRRLPTRSKGKAKSPSAAAKSPKKTVGRPTLAPFTPTLTAASTLPSSAARGALPNMPALGSLRASSPPRNLGLSALPGTQLGALPALQGTQLSSLPPLQSTQFTGLSSRPSTQIAGLSGLPSMTVPTGTRSRSGSVTSPRVSSQRSPRSGTTSPLRTSGLPTVSPTRVSGGRVSPPRSTGLPGSRSSFIPVGSLGGVDSSLMNI